MECASGLGAPSLDPNRCAAGPENLRWILPITFPGPRKECNASGSSRHSFAASPGDTRLTA